MAGIKLDKAQRAELKELREKYRASEEGINKALEAYATAVNEAREKLRLVVEPHNEMAAEVREFTEGVGAGLRETLSERSERWQESAAGVRAEQMVSSWEGFSVEDVELPEEVDPEQAEEVADALDQLLEDPEEDE